MKIYEVEYRGKIYEIEGPDNATEADLLEAIASYSPPAPAAPPPAPQKSLLERVKDRFSAAGEQYIPSTAEMLNTGFDVPVQPRNVLERVPSPEILESVPKTMPSDAVLVELSRSPEQQAMRRAMAQPWQVASPVQERPIDVAAGVTSDLTGFDKDAIARIYDKATLPFEMAASTGELGAKILSLPTGGAAEPLVEGFQWINKKLRALKSSRYQAEAIGLDNMMSDPNAGPLDIARYLVQRPEFLVELGVPSAGATLAIGGIGRVVGLANAARATRFGAPAEEVAKAYETGATAGALVGNALANAGDTFSETDADLAGKYLAALGAGVGTAVVNRFIPGAEKFVATGGGVKRAIGAVLAEAPNEGLEALTQKLGQKSAEGQPIGNEDLKQATLEALLAPVGGALATAPFASRQAPAAPPVFPSYGVEPEQPQSVVPIIPKLPATTSVPAQTVGQTAPVDVDEYAAANKEATELERVVFAKRADGTLQVTGDQTTIEAILPPEVPKLQTPNGVVVGKTKADEVEQTLQQITVPESFQSVDEATKWAADHGMADKTVAVKMAGEVVLAPVEKPLKRAEIEADKEAVKSLNESFNRTGRAASVQLETTSALNTTERAIVSAFRSAFDMPVTVVKNLPKASGVYYDNRVFVDPVNAKARLNQPGAVAWVTFHEVWHDLHHRADSEPEAFQTAKQLRDAMSLYLRDDAIDERQAREQAAFDRAGQQVTVSRTYAIQEIEADVGASMMLDPRFWGDTYKVDPSGSLARKVFYRFMQAATKLIAVVRGSPLDASIWVKDIDRVRDAYVQAFVQHFGRQKGPSPAGEPTLAQVYQGSPNQFTKFDSSKIGSGEGAQQYGYGLYFADKADVAKSYRPRDEKYEARLLELQQRAEAADNYPAAQVYENLLLGKTPSEVEATLDGYSPQDMTRARAALEIGRSLYQKRSGALYRTELADDAIGKMLDWDAPLESQPEAVREAVYRAAQGRWINDIGGRRFVSAPDATMTGGEAYRRIATLLGTDSAASEALRKGGVPGIKYLDQLSRERGEGTRNYVVFPGEEGVLGKPEMALSQAEDVAAAERGTSPQIIVSTKPGRLGFITYPKARDLEFVTSRLHERVLQTLNQTSTQSYLAGLMGKLKSRGIRGLWANELEDTLVLVPDAQLQFEQARSVANLLGFAFAQEGVITTSPTVDADVTSAPGVLIGLPKWRKLTHEQIDAALREASRAGFFGASEALSGRGIKFLFFPEGDQDIEQQYRDWMARVNKVQAATGFQELHSFTNISTLDESNEHWQKASRLQGAGGTRGQDGAAGSLDLFRGTVDHLLAPYVASLQTEGFGFSAGGFARAHKLDAEQARYLREKIAELENINKHGVIPKLRQKVSIANARNVGTRAELLLSTTNKNAAEQLRALDRILADNPNATSSAQAWLKMEAQAYGTNDVPMAPRRFIDMINGDGLEDQLRSLSPGQVADADHGFENAAKFRQAYESGRVKPETTVKLFLWSFLSRGVSPYVQESAFLDLATHVGPFVDRALAGTFSEDDVQEWHDVVKRFIPANSPGKGTIHNANAFAATFLRRMAERMPDGRTKLQYMHDLLADPAKSGAEIRREFVRLGEGVGIDNKVISFTLLVVGHDDVMVLDRVQISNTYDNGQFGDYNLYDGITRYGYIDQYGRSIYLGSTAEDRIRAEALANEDGILQSLTPGSGLAGITAGVRGLMLYEAMERALQDTLPAVYAKLQADGLRGPDVRPTPGRWHWESWVAYSGQEASHKTLDALLEEVEGNEKAFESATAKQGEYGSYSYATEYGRDPDPYFTYPDSTGKRYRMTMPQYREFFDKLRKQIPPKNFRVSKDMDGNDRTRPWFEDPRIDRDKLDALVQQHGAPMLSQSYEQYDGIEIRRQVTLDDTGENAVITLDAGMALRSLDDRESMLRKLLECVS